MKTKKYIFDRKGKKRPVMAILRNVLVRKETTGILFSWKIHNFPTSMTQLSDCCASEVTLVIL